MDKQLSIHDELQREARSKAVEEIRRLRFSQLSALLVEKGHTERNAADIAWGTVYGSGTNLDV